MIDGPEKAHQAHMQEWQLMTSQTSVGCSKHEKHVAPN
jgi:hypothetical protein